MYLAGDELRLQGLAIDPDEFVRRGRPRGQLNVAQLAAILQVAQPVPVHVDEHLGEAVELRHQLFHVRGVPLAVGPRVFDRVEQAIGVVKLAVLQRQEHRGEGLQPEHVVDDEGRGRVVGPVMERGNSIVLPVGITFLKIFSPRLIQGSDRAAQVSVVVGRAQVDLAVVVVGQDPWENGVLVQVIVRPPRDRVQEHQVLEVGDLPPLPLLRHI